MRNSFCIFFLLWVTLDVFSGEKCLFTIGSDFIVTDTISKNLSDTSRIFNLSDVVVKGSNIITKPFYISENIDKKIKQITSGIKYEKERVNNEDYEGKRDYEKSNKFNLLHTVLYNSYTQDVKM